MSAQGTQAEPAVTGTLHLEDAVATDAVGRRLARRLGSDSGLTIFLIGDLGAGKTTLARAFLRELGVSGPVRSPTYTLVEPYEIRGHRWLHLDLYRLTDPGELEQLGLADTPPEEGGWLVEWPERGHGRLPSPQLELRLAATAVQAGRGRVFEWIARGERAVDACSGLADR